MDVLKFLTDFNDHREATFHSFERATNDEKEKIVREVINWLDGNNVGDHFEKYLIFTSHCSDNIKYLIALSSKFAQALTDLPLLEEHEKLTNKILASSTVAIFLGFTGPILMDPNNQEIIDEAKRWAHRD